MRTVDFISESFSRHKTKIICVVIHFRIITISTVRLGQNAIFELF